MSDKVSVVTATYNCGRFLGGAIESVLAQTFQNWEMIIVDDGSTDNTAEVVRPYLQDQRIRYQQTNHVGAAGARNAAIRLARGSFLAILDADDEWLPEKLERQLALFRQDPGLGLVYSARAWMNEAGERFEEENPPFHRGHVLAQLFRMNFVCHSSAMIRRAVLDDVGLFDTRWEPSEDYELLLRVARRYRFDYVDRPLVVYRVQQRQGHAEKRYVVVLNIRRHFLDDLGARAELDPACIRIAYAKTFLHYGQAIALRSRLAALPWYCRALAKQPNSFEAWKDSVRLLIPAAVQGLLCRIFRRRTGHRREG